MSHWLLSCEQCPEGIHPFFMANSGAEKYELKNGPGIVDLVDCKSFRKDIILDEVKALGFMCPFEPCEEYIRQCMHDEFIVVCDPTSKFGEMFLLIYSKEGIDEYNKVVMKAKEEDEELKNFEEEAQAAEKAEEEAILNAIYKDKPFYVKPYNSDSAEATEREINSQNDFVKNRSTIMIEQKSMIYQSITYSDRNHHISGIIEFQPMHVSDFDLFREQQNFGTQSVPNKYDVGLQTSNLRRKNTSVQYEAISADCLNMSDISRSLKNVFPFIDTALKQNETLNTFSEFLEVKAEHTTKRNNTIRSTEGTLKENRVFTDLRHSKGKVITSIQCHPSVNGIIAVSLATSKSLNEHISDMSNTLVSSYIVIWDSIEWLKPRGFLKSPTSCSAFKFNPSLPSCVIAGCDSGHVVLWKLPFNWLKDNVDESLEQGKDKISRDDFFYGNMSCLESQNEIQPSAVSDLSHQKMITDLCWLPPTLQIDARGKRVSHEYINTISYQFLSVAGDGQILVWDIRYEEILAGKHPYLTKIRSKKQSNDSKYPSTMRPRWRPLYTMKPKRLEKFEPLSPCRIAYDDHRSISFKDNEKFICASEEGDIFEIDFTDNSSIAVANQALETCDYVNWIGPDHQRPCLSLHNSPFISGLYLSISDWGFHLWSKTRTDTALFVSPRAKVRLTGGCWSPNRPGIILLSRFDGSIEIWDLTYSSSDPKVSLAAIPVTISSMEFIGSEHESNLLAVGDTEGSLFLFELPLDLTKIFPNEKDQMLDFINREARKLLRTESKVNQKENAIQNKPVIQSCYTDDEIKETFDMFEKKLALELDLNLQLEEQTISK